MLVHGLTASICILGALREEVDAVARWARKEGLIGFGPTCLNPYAGYPGIRSDPDGHKLEFSHSQAVGKPAAQTSSYGGAALEYEHIQATGSAQHRSCICRVISSPGKPGYFATEKGGGTGSIAGAHGSPSGNFMGIHRHDSWKRRPPEIPRCFSAENFSSTWNKLRCLRFSRLHTERNYARSAELSVFRIGC